MFAVGILAFLFVDVCEHAFGITEGAVQDWKARQAGFADVLWRAFGPVLKEGLHFEVEHRPRLAKLLRCES